MQGNRQQQILTGKSRGSTKSRGCRAALVGAVVVHPLFFFLTFVWGALFGAGVIFSLGPNTSRYGLEGGTNAIAGMAVYYIFSFGIVPIVVSGVGVALAAGLGQLLRHNIQEKKVATKDSQAEPDAAAERPHE